MSSRLPSVGVVTTSTNSLSRGYPAFLACVDTWAKWADQMVIVDGGTTDDTYSVLKDWTTARNYEIYYGPETHWDTHGCFHAGQWTMNTLAGLKRLQTDWAVIAPADHILDVSTAGTARQDLARLGDSLGCRFARKRMRIGRPGVQTDSKWYVLNLKKIRSVGIGLGWGLDRAIGCLADHPLVIDQRSPFLDPANGALKEHLAGLAMPLAATLPLTCWSYGFYFYSMAHALRHLREFHSVYGVRYSGQAPREDAWHLARAGIGPILWRCDRAEELGKPHIPAIQRIVEDFFHPEMLGTAVMSQDKPWRGQTLLKRASDKLDTWRFRRTGFKSVMDAQTWHPLDEKTPKPLDVRTLYREQDRLLSADSRIDWDETKKRTLASTRHAYV